MGKRSSLNERAFKSCYIGKTKINKMTLEEVRKIIRECSLKIREIDGILYEDEDNDTGMGIMELADERYKIANQLGLARDRESKICHKEYMSKISFERDLMEKIRRRS